MTRARQHCSGHSYATEAAHAVHEYAFDTLRRPQLIAIIDPGNNRSIRVVEKLAMRCDGDVMFDGYTQPDRSHVIPRNAHWPFLIHDQPQRKSQ